MKYRPSKYAFTKPRMISPSKFLILVVEFPELQAARFLITCTAQHLRFSILTNVISPPDFSYPQVIIPEGGGSYGAGLSADTLPMHGLGYGLPLSRLYARYFRQDGGVLNIFT